MNYKKLIYLAFKLRQETFKMFIKKGEAHLGGSFSLIEALVALFEIIIKKKDKFILSKSHASFPLCIVLKKKGFNPKITTHLELDSKNGIYCTTGSLGHGLPIATGMAFARKQQKKPGRQTEDCKPSVLLWFARCPKNKSVLMPNPCWMPGSGLLQNKTDKHKIYSLH